jgi:hypothetical protein
LYSTATINFGSFQEGGIGPKLIVGMQKIKKDEEKNRFNLKILNKGERL